MAAKHDDSETTEAASFSVPLEIKGKFKMEGSTTDSDFSDLDIQTFAEKTVTPSHPRKSDTSPYGSPNKRGYPSHRENFNTDDFYSDQSPKKRNLNQYPFGPGKENLFNLNWTNSVSSRDSAIGNSLMSTLGSVLTDTSSSYETNSDSEQSLSGNANGVYGRYQKIDATAGESSEEEILVLHRLPGENLGMILGIDSDQTHQTIKSVYVKTVTIGGAAYRATGSKKGIQEGDQIIQINGTDLNILTHDECLTVLREMPLRVILKIRRGKKRMAPAVKLSPALSTASSKSFGDSPSPLVYSESSSYSESEEEERKFQGFNLIHVEIDKHPNESLGLSIVPSYGSTRQFYQIKRLLPSGAAARSQRIRVGDRLLSCNGFSLRNVSQSKCLSVLKSEGNSGDLELELLRPKENDDPLEISLKVSNTDSTVTLHSPSQQRKNFIADIPESDSDNEVVLNKFQYIDNTVLDRDLKTVDQNQKSDVPKLNNVEKLGNSDCVDSNSKSDTGRKSKNPNMEESGESWNYAVPPPAEFSTYGPAVPPPAEFSEGQSPIFNQSNNGVPVTNIDEIIQSYRQSPTVQNQENYIPQSRVDDTEEPIRQMESLTGLQRDESDSLDNSLTYFDENLPEEEGLDVIDSYQEDNAINQFVRGDEDVDAVDAEPFIPPAPVNIEDIDVHSNDDDEFVVPVTVQRQKHIPFTSAVTVSSVSPTEIEEDQIIPSVEHRKRVPASATIKLEERTHQEPPPKPVPQPRVKPTIINVERSPAPKIYSMSDERGVEEEMVRAEFKERQSGNEKFREKLGGEVEEEIVAVEVKRDQSWNAAKLAVITNMWSKSARKNNEREEDSEKTNLKSVINVMNSKKKQDVKEAGDLSKKDEIEIVKEETYSKTDPREQSVHKNVIKVSAPVRMDDAKLENKAEKMESVSPTTDKQAVRVEPVNTEIAKQTVTVNNAIVDSKPTETEHTPITSATKTEVQAPAPAVISKAAEENVPSTTPAKSTPAPSPSPFKSSIAITKPSSLLSTIRSQNSSSATLKPLSSIKPVTVSAKTFSLGKPAGLSGSLSSGRTSLLSTIHGTSTSAKSTRSEEEPFLVSVLKGILGLGMKVSLTPEGCVRVDEIQSSGPIAKDGNIRVGDYLLSINNTELTGLPDAKIQQILRLLPRGIAKILVSVKPPSTDGVARPTELNLSTNESAVSKHSPLSSPRTMSRPDSVSPALSPRQHTSSSLQPSSPRQPVMEKSIAPAEESTVKVTVNHDQYAPETKKVPPPVAPKPKHSSPPDHISKTGSLRGSGGYVSSAVGRTNSFGKREPQTVDVKPHIQPKKADYVSSARKMVPEKEEKEPIDTVVFASVDFNKMNAVSRQTMGQPKSKHVPEPQMIPKGHVDYVSSAKPKVSSPTTTSPRAKDIPQSPYAYEDVSTKISPVKLNSALSPRRKNEDKFTYGVSLTGNRVKGKEGEQHITDSPLSSPKSPVTNTLHSPNIVTPSVKSESEFTASPEVHPKPVSSPQGSTPDGGQEDTVPETSQQDTTPNVESSNQSAMESCNQSAVESSNQSAVESTDEVNVEQPCEHSTDQPNITDPFQTTKNVDNISESLCTEVDIVSTTEPLVDTAIALTNDSAQNDNVVISQKDDPINGENKIDVEILKGDSDPEDIKDMADDVDSELFVKFVEDIVRGAIQKGLDEFKTSEADDKMADPDEEGKTVADEMSPVHDSHPRAVMETKSLRAFLQKLDSSEKETPLPDSYSLNQNPVAEKMAIEMLKTLEEDGDSHSRHTNSATKQSANTTKSLLTNTNNGEQVDQCMSIPQASVACNDVVLDTPSSVSMSVDGVNVSSVDSVGDVTVNALSIQEPKSCTEQQSEAGSHGVGDCVNSDVRMEVCDEDIENIEIVLNDDCLDARVSPINLLGGDCISRTESDVRDYFTISSRRPWSVCMGEHQFSSDSLDVSDIGPSLDRLSPVELENLLNPANDELDSFGFGSDARLVVVLLDTSAREELGLRLSTNKSGPLVVSEVMSGSVADGAGHIQVGDKVVSIDGVSTASLTPGAVMNGIDTSISGHLIVLTRVEEDSTDTEAPPTPDAPPPELPVTAPPGVSTPTEQVEARGVVHDSIIMEESKESETSRQESETSRQEVVDSEPEVLSEDKDKVVKSSEDSNVQESGAELDKLALNDNWTTDSLNVTIPNILEVSSPQGSQDSGLGMPSPLDTPSSLEDSISTEKSKEEEPKVEHSFSNGDLNQALSSPTSTLDSLGPLSSPSSTLDSLGPLSPAVSDDADNDSAEKETFEVVMNKGVTGLGFLIEGGKASAKGDQPLTIRRIFKGGPAEKCGMLKVKDEILKVNGLEVTEMRHSEAWTHLKFLDEGPVYLLIRRKVQPAED